jgi:sporulation protein YlmC with PRC-barrel domain
MSLKNKIFALALVGAFYPGFMAGAQDSTAPAEQRRLGLLKQASVLLQRKVVDAREKNLGRVNDLVLDVANGQVPLVLVTSSSDEVALVPTGSFSDASIACLVMNIDKKVFTTAPHVAKTGAINALDKNRFEESCRHFGQTCPQNPGGPSAKLVSASGMLGVPVRGHSNETLGTLKDIMVDLPFGRIVYYVIEPVTSSSGQGDFYVVPPSAIRPGDSAGFLVLPVERARFLAGPHFQKEFWNDMALPALAAAVRQHYETGLGPPAQARPVAVTARTPDRTPGASGRSDQEITQAVLTEIVRRTSGFMSIQIAVTTVNGRVTLSGNVKNEKQIKQIVSAAERVVGPANVDNRLEAGVKARTAQL